MHNIWRIARYEYGRQVRRRGFLFMAIGMPLFMVALVVIIGLITFLSLQSSAEDQLGFVDRTERFADVDPSTLDLSLVIPLERYADEEAARAAFDQRLIDAYVVVPEDYIETGTIRTVAHEPLSDDAVAQLRAMLRAGLLAETPAANRARLSQPINLTLRTLERDQEVGGESFLLFALPYAFAMLFFITTFTTSGYLLQALTEEKEDRVAEIMATTVSPTQMMAGKIVGLYFVGLTQLAIWLAMIASAVLVITRNFDWLSGLQLPGPVLALALIYFLLGYLLIAACYATAGAAVPTAHEAQPLITPISLLAVAPFMLLVVILSNPNGLIATIFSLIPFSAPITMVMRLVIADVPVWQVILSLSLLLLTAIGVVVLSARVMRLGMLRYGKRLKLAELFNG